MFERPTDPAARGKTLQVRSRAARPRFPRKAGTMYDTHTRGNQRIASDWLVGSLEVVR